MRPLSGPTVRCLATTMAALLAVTAAASSPAPPFRDPALPAEERLTNLLSLMTPEEKLQALAEARDITRSGKSPFPMLMVWGPQADLARDPRWGRSEEVYGEDPFFNGVMATAFARGIQGDVVELGVRRAPLLRVLLGAVPHGVPGRGGQRGDGLLQRLERQRLSAVEQTLAKHDVQAELAALKARVDALQGQIQALEERLRAWRRAPEALRLRDGAWTIVAVHCDSDRVRIEPFEAIELDLERLGPAPPPAP